MSVCPLIFTYASHIYVFMVDYTGLCISLPKIILYTKLYHDKT